MHTQRLVINSVNFWPLPSWRAFEGREKQQHADRVLLPLRPSAHTLVSPNPVQHLCSEGILSFTGEKNRCSEWLHS